MDGYINGFLINYLVLIVNVILTRNVLIVRVNTF